MPEELSTALAALRPLLLDADELVRAIAAGRRRGTAPAHRRAEVRPVDLRAGRRLQVVVTDDRPGAAPLTRNVSGADAEAVVDALLAEPFGNWHVETRHQTHQLRVTKKGQAQVHVAPTSRRAVQARPADHDRVKERLLDPGDPLFSALGADADKRRQVDAFLRLLAPAAGRALDRAASSGRPAHVVDLGCGNAYLTFAAHRYLAGRAAERGLDVRTVGIDVRAELVERNTELAHRLGLTGLGFVVGAIGDADPRFDGPDVADPGLGGQGRDQDGEVDAVLALHACDTATDDALARAVGWRAPVVLAAPCCHHDVQAQLARRQAEGHPPPHPYAALTRHPILRERFADVLTDVLRAGVLRSVGYRVEVVEFVDSRHTPRNALIRAELTDAPGQATRLAETRDLAREWGLSPRLAALVLPGGSL
ncbi:MAG TPA: SAM-dependent methyltransferase [Kineosporiaceae bacterium]